MTFVSNGEGTLILSIEKVLVTESRRRRSRSYTFIDGKNNFERIGDSYLVELRFYGCGRSTRDDIYDYIFKEKDDIVSVSNIDEVAVGEQYYTYTGSVSIERPKTDLVWTRDLDSKSSDSMVTRMVFACDSRSFTTKV